MTSGNEPSFTAGVGNCTSDCETTRSARDRSRFTTRVTRSQELRTWTTQTHANSWPASREHSCGYPANHPGKPQRPEHTAKPKRSTIHEEQANELATELTRTRNTTSATRKNLASMTMWNQLENSEKKPIISISKSFVNTMLPVHRLLPPAPATVQPGKLGWLPRSTAASQKPRAR